MSECTDPFHEEDNNHGIEYDVQQDGMLVTGYECPSCHMRTLSLLDDDDVDITDRFVVARRMPGDSETAGE